MLKSAFILPFQSDIMSHTNRFARNQGVASRARGGQGRKVCAAQRTLDGEDARPIIRL
jgi:hypothetical protein